MNHDRRPRATMLVLGALALALCATHVRAAGPKLDAGDLKELDAILADLNDLLPQ